jgi:hypothetical protein
MGRGGQHDEDYEDYSEGEEEEMSTDEEGDEEEVEGEIAAGPRPVAGLGAGLPGLGVKSGPSAGTLAHSSSQQLIHIADCIATSAIPHNSPNAMDSMLFTLF